MACTCAWKQLPQPTRLTALRWIGMRIDDPAPDIHKMAEGLGCTLVASEQVRTKSELRKVMGEALAALKSGKPVVLDVRVRPEGYSSNLEKARWGFGRPSCRIRRRGHRLRRRTASLTTERRLCIHQAQKASRSSGIVKQ